MKVIYRSNNSGGEWWLQDKDWRALQDNGWELEPLMTKDQDGRWLGAICTAASKDYPGLREAIAGWESATGMSASDSGCDCCGPPHEFHTEDYSEYLSGAEATGGVSQ